MSELNNNNIKIKTYEVLSSTKNTPGVDGSVYSNDIQRFFQNTSNKQGKIGNVIITNGNKKIILSDDYKEQYFNRIYDITIWFAMVKFMRENK